MGNPTCRPFYGEYAWAYDLLVARPVCRECACIAALLSQRDIGAGARILDAGCGTGRYTMGLARRGYLVTGLDRSAPLIAEAQKRVGTTDLPVAFAVGEILALPSVPPFDGILCRGVLNDLLDERSRQEVFRGRLTFRSVTQLDHHNQQLLVAERHTLQRDDVETVAVYDFRMRCWTQEELHGHLTRAGFSSIVYLGDYDSAVPLGASDRMVSVASRT